MPKQIDLEPIEFRGKPERGQPVFKQGGLRRLGAYVAVILFGLAVSWVMYWPAHWVMDWIRAAVGN